MLEVLFGAAAIVAIIGFIAKVLMHCLTHLRQKHEQEPNRQQSPLEQGLRLLLHAYELAEKKGLPTAWKFAVDATELRDLGLNNSHFRELLHEGHVEHAEAFTRPGMAGRGFHRRCEPTFGDTTCFVLTEKGVEYARKLLARQDSK